MTSERVEYRFVVDAFTPSTIPQAKLAEYLADLSVLYGSDHFVHLVSLEESSLAIVSAVEADADADVSDRLQSAEGEDASLDVRRAYQSLAARVRADGGSAFIARGPSRVLEFRRPDVPEPVSYGPFWQPGDLSGVVILLGGKTERVSVKIQDGNGVVHTCKADREMAKRLREYLFEQPVRLTGRGRWTRESNGRWRMDQFDISNFAPLEDDALTDIVARLRAVEGRWKDRPDPLAELDEIRRGS